MVASSGTPTLVVVGSAALLDLILQVDRFPGPSEVANLLPGNNALWMPGGCAITIALAAIQQGVRVRLWHPLPEDADSEYPLAHLRQAGVDLTVCPRFSGPPGRCVIIYADHQRAAWTSLPQGDDFDFDHAVLSGVDHVIVTAKWGRWTERLLMLDQQSNIPCSLGGDTPTTGEGFPGYGVVVDE